jgi:hypothetical protein
MSTPASNRTLVRRIKAELPPALEWTPTDLLLLRMSEDQARDLDELEKRDDLPSMREARNQRLVLCRLIGQLYLPQHARSSVLRAQKAARARWQGDAAS